MSTALSDAGVQFADASGATNAPPFAFKNLQASATGLSATVTVTADEVALANSANFYLTARAVSLSISGASSGVANGLDTGTLAASTWYSVWVISNGATTAGLLSLSATAPTLPSGYTFKARIGWIRTDASGNKYPLSFKQYGRRTRYVVAGNVANLPIMASGALGSFSVPTWTNVAWANFAPSTASQLSLVGSSSSASYAWILAPNSNYGAAGSITNPPLAANSANPSGNNYAELTIESANISWAGQGSSSLAIAGWEDNL